MKPCLFGYNKPSNIEDALAILDTHPNSVVLAGGQSLVAMLNMRLVAPSHVVDINGLASLKEIAVDDGWLRVGALVRHCDILKSQTVSESAPLISQAVHHIGHPAIRNRGTIGGSLAHNDPAADLPAAILALDGRITASSTGEHRTIDVVDFFQDLFTTALRESEILSEVFVPTQPRSSGSAYVKFANKASHYAIVGVASAVTLANGKCTSAAIGITGAGPTPYRASHVESQLIDSSLDENTISAASENAGKGVDMNDDIQASGEYRAHLVKVLTIRSLNLAIERAG